MVVVLMMVAMMVMVVSIGWIDMLTNQVDKWDKVAKEGAGKSESPDHKPVMKASNNLQCQCCCLHLM